MKIFILIIIILLIFMICKNNTTKPIIQKPIIQKPIINQQGAGKGFSKYYSPQVCSPDNNCFIGSYVRNK